jgi:hypothetical protein
MREVVDRREVNLLPTNVVSLQLETCEAGGNAIEEIVGDNGVG